MAGGQVCKMLSAGQLQPGLSHQTDVRTQVGGLGHGPLASLGLDPESGSGLGMRFVNVDTFCVRTF